MQDANRGRVAQRLVNNAISLGQTKQGGELFFAGIGVQIEMQSNLLEPGRHIFGNTKRTTKIEIALRSNRCAA